MKGVLHPAFVQRMRERIDRDTRSLPRVVADFVKAGHEARVGLVSARNSPVGVANAWARDEIESLRAANLHLAYDEARIRYLAENRSRIAGGLREKARYGFVRGFGIDPPSDRGTTEQGRLNRMACPKWWRRGIRRSSTRSGEDAIRRIGLTRKGLSPYVSDHACRHRGARNRRMRSWLDSHVMVNEAGEQLNLLDLAEHSIANPAIRRGEMMTRAKGFEEIAMYHRHVAEFYTLTCPSTFHAQLAQAGGNPAYQRQTVRDGQAWLCKQWAKARAKFKRLSILCYGFRVAEPHHDGTPHWHLLLFYPPSQADTVRFILRSIWLSVDGDEPGAEQHRCKVETVDSTKGSATGYIAKYIAKNIDAQGAIGEATDQETGERVSDGTVRVITWASVHGIRQFQQIGGPAVGLWRECRRLREEVEDADIERARAQADAGNFAGFIHATGGIAIGRRTGLRLEKADSGLPNYYGEPKPAQIIGIRYASALELTRPHQWTIKPKDTPIFSSGPAMASVFGAGAANLDGHDWSKSSPDASVRARVREALAALPMEDKREADRLWIRVFSDLGPVAITVRAAGEPSAWTNPNESSMYGP